jgi:phenylalanyl-tRNA synthetase beta subunit
MSANIIKELFPDAVISLVADVYPKYDTPYHVGISLNELNGILGATYTSEVVEKTLSQLSFSYEKIVPEEYIKALYPTLIGKTYKNPSSMREDAPEAFSCSSLVSYLYKGIWMPSLSVDKFVFAQKISKEDLIFGDLVFANSGEGIIRYESIEFLRGTKVPEGVDHVGMYLGDDTILHATKIEGKVVVQTYDEFAKSRTVVGYGRITNDLYEERYVVTVPPERLDIRIKEDLAEEIGRIIGYDTLTPSLPQLTRTGVLPKRTYYENKVREILLANGFSEVMTYTFGNEGEVELVKGLADDKEKLRTNLRNGLMKALNTNLYNAPLLGKQEIKVFEFGNVFINGIERKNLALGYLFPSEKLNNKNAVILEEIISKINSKLIEYSKSDLHVLGVQGIEGYIIWKGEMSHKTVREIDFDGLIDSLREPTIYEAPTFASLPVITYQTVSPYPFIARDIAMWVPQGVTWESIYELITEVRNPLVTRTDLFDTFTKTGDGKELTSYAFRLVFQSFERTLTDDEVNEMMGAYYELFKNKGYEVR